MRGWCARWCSGWGRTRVRWLAALVCWGALAALALPRLQVPVAPHARAPAPPARLLLQSEAAASTPAPGAPLLPATDTRVLSEDELRADAERRLPSLPLTYWHKHKDDKNKFYKKKECAPFPSIYELEFHNTYWQTLRASEGVFHLYGAYLDVRNTSRIGPAVRVLAVHDRIKPTLATHCQLWFEEREQPVVVRNLEYKYVWNSKWGNYRDRVLQPYLLACVLPAEVRHLVPASVSLVENPCDRATNNLRVHYDPPPPAAPRRDFAVCVKGLDFLHEDLSVRLVEWIELVRLLGADKIFFYELQVHPNITKVLDYYAALGAVSVTPITLPGGQPNLPGLQHMYLKKKTTHKRQMELIPYNDCLYRNMYRYRWLALLDIDEVIVPLEDSDWSGLMRRALPLAAPAAGKPARSSYHASNLYFLDSLRHEHGWEDGVPRYMHMLQHVYRTRNFTKPGQYVKAFHETSRVLALHNHFPLACLGGACSSYALETRHARLQHYRADCVTALSKSCAELRAQPVRDTALWRWREPLVARVEAALRALGFLPPHRGRKPPRALAPDNSSRRATHYHPAAITLRGGLVLLHAVLDSTMCRIYAWRGVSRGAGSARQPCVCAACCGAARRRGAHSSCDLPTRLPRTRILSSLSRHSNQSNRFTMAAKFVVIFVACVALTHGAMVRRDAPPDALAEIEKHAKEFQKTLSDQFTALMNSKNTQDFNKAIKEGSESVVSQLTAFSNSLQGALADANGKAKDALEQAHKNIQHTVEELRKAHPDVEKEANAVKEKLQAAMQSTVQETQKLAKEVAGNLDETNKKLAPQIKSAYDSFVQQVEAVQKKLHEAATKQ